MFNREFVVKTMKEAVVKIERDRGEAAIEDARNEFLDQLKRGCEKRREIEDLILDEARRGGNTVQIKTTLLDEYNRYDNDPKIKLGMSAKIAVEYLKEKRFSVDVLLHKLEVRDPVKKLVNMTSDATIIVSW